MKRNKLRLSKEEHDRLSKLIKNILLLIKSLKSHNKEVGASMALTEESLSFEESMISKKYKKIMNKIDCKLNARERDIKIIQRKLFLCSISEKRSSPNALSEINSMVRLTWMKTKILSKSLDKVYIMIIDFLKKKDS